MASRRYLPAVLTACVLASPASAGAPDVVASIKPIHSLVAGVMRGVGEPELLIEGAGSPHTYSLRPSEARALERAEVVFWVGEGLETFLTKPLATLASEARLVALAQAPGVTLLPARRGGMWHDPPDEGRFEDVGHHADREDRADPVAAEQAHRHGGTDMHVWLDPRNAMAMVDAIAAALAEADPENAGAYGENAASLRRALEDLDRNLAQTLAPVAKRPFVVFHDGYQYFEKRYGLNAIGSISLGPDRRPGARRLGEIRDALEESEAACVFAEPQFEPALVATVVEGSSARSGVLDPLGAALDEGPDQYFRLLENLAASLVGCLGAEGSN